MVDSLRSDVRDDLPLLVEADGRMQALFARFSDADWGYRKLTEEEKAGASAAKWWKKVPHVPDGKRLSTRWVSELSCTVVWADAQLRDVRKVNDAAIARMSVPESYLDKLPKNARGVVRDSMRKTLAKEGEVDALSILAKEGIALEDKLAVMELVNNLEKAALVWELKAEEKGAKSKKDRLGANTRRFIASVKAASHSIAQHRTASHSIAQHRTASHSIVQHRTASHSIVQHRTASHSIAQHRTASHSIAQHRTASHRIA